MPAVIFVAYIAIPECVYLFDSPFCGIIILYLLRMEHGFCFLLNHILSRAIDANDFSYSCKEERNEYP